MSKRIIIDGATYRIRRGTLVRVPDEWIGVVTSRQTINKRQSKGTRKTAMRDHIICARKHPSQRAPRHQSPGDHRNIDWEEWS